MRLYLKVVAIFVLMIGLTAQGTVFAESMAPSCFLPVMGCQMKNCPMAKSMSMGGQKMDCCRFDSKNETHSEALPVAPKNGAVQGAEFIHATPVHFGTHKVIPNPVSEFIEHESPHTPEPLYEKNQDLRI